MLTKVIRCLLGLVLAVLPFFSKDTHKGAAEMAPPTHYATDFPHNHDPVPQDRGSHSSRHAAEGTATLPAGDVVMVALKEHYDDLFHDEPTRYDPGLNLGGSEQAAVSGSASVPTSWNGVTFLGEF